jgi:putative transposase
LFYHLVWAVKDREPLIDEERVAVIQRSFRATCHENGTVVHAIGMMPDHVHLAVSIPPRLSIAALARELKGSSSHLLNHDAKMASDGSFAWQAEYGVVSFGERSLADVVAYVSNQPQRHADRLEWPTFERIERERPIVPSPGGAS